MYAFPKDHFGAVASQYAQYRPLHPPEVFEFLSEHCREHELAWDCGCGSGQAALGLTAFFSFIHATDASMSQIQCAQHHDRIQYSHRRAEDSKFESGIFDLVVSAEAVHWFDIPKFFAEAERVLKPGGLIAVWCYGFPRIQADIDEILSRDFDAVINPFRPPEVANIRKEYQNLDFPFAEIPVPPIVRRDFWSCDQLLGNFRTWSAVQKHKKQTGRDPVDVLEQTLLPLWGNREQKREVFSEMSIRCGSTSTHPVPISFEPGFPGNELR